MTITLLPLVDYVFTNNIDMNMTWQGDVVFSVRIRFLTLSFRYSIISRQRVITITAYLNNNIYIGNKIFLEIFPILPSKQVGDRYTYDTLIDKDPLQARASAYLGLSPRTLWAKTIVPPSDNVQP